VGFAAGGIIASSLAFFFYVKEGRKEKAGRLSQKAYVVVVAVRCELSKPWLQYQCGWSPHCWIVSFNPHFMTHKVVAISWFVKTLKLES
jgi:hypothetical protein